MILLICKENVPDRHDHLVRKDRIRFYRQLGAKVLDGVNYSLPSQDLGKPEELSKTRVLENVQGVESVTLSLDREMLVSTDLRHSLIREEIRKLEKDWMT
jgi:hypothetical protein